MNSYSICPICKSKTDFLDVVDLNKSCEEIKGSFSSLSGEAIYYSYCENCSFTYSNTMYSWSEEDFKNKIYNDSYIKIDPDYKSVRPESNASTIMKLFNKEEIKHLDYGGGNGYLSNILKSNNWDSNSYDFYFDKDKSLNSLGKYNLITSYEVFEHVCDVDKLMQDLSTLLDEKGLILFSTLLSDGNIEKNKRLSWWYASPRNGHISLFSKKSLGLLAKKYGFYLGSFNSSLHVMFKTIPNWGKHIFDLNK